MCRFKLFPLALEVSGAQDMQSSVSAVLGILEAGLEACESLEPDSLQLVPQLIQARAAAVSAQVLSHCPASRRKKQDTAHRTCPYHSQTPPAMHPTHA